MSYTHSTYNGWTNKPTWLVHLWLTNDDGLYHATHEVLQHAQDREAALRAFVEEVHDVEAAVSNAGLLADLLGWALAMVNWHEVVDAFASEEELS